MMGNCTYKSPFGEIQLTVLDGLLQKVEMGEFTPQKTPSLLENSSGARNVFTLFLDSYFDGRPMAISLERLYMEPIATFQRKVYRVIMEIGFGETASYGDVAKMVGKPKAARAVGRAAATNPFPIFIPCHRVIRSNGELGGFIAGEKWKQGLRKREFQTKKM